MTPIKSEAGVANAVVSQDNLSKSLYSSVIEQVISQAWLSLNV